MDENPNSLFGHALDVSEGSLGRWSELPTHLKIEVLRNVPFPTLRSFMFVSKECLALVLLMKPEVKSLSFYPMYRYSNLCPTGCYVGSAVIEIRYYTRRCCTGKASLSALAFSFEVDEDGGSVVSRIVKKEDPSLDKIGAHYSDEPLSSAFRVFVQFARTLTVSKLKIVLKTTEQVIGELPTAPPLSCQQLIIHTEDPAVPPLLFRFVSPGTKLCIRSYEDVYVGDVSLESSVFDSEVVRAAPSFESVIATQITDHQLPLLRGEVLYLIAPGVTSKGINRLIWQWLHEERRIVKVTVSRTRRLVSSKVLQGLDPSRILSESELPKNLFVGTAKRCVKFRAGVRRSSGARLLIALGSHSCHLFDPSLKPAV